MKKLSKLCSALLVGLLVCFYLMIPIQAAGVEPNSSPYINTDRIEIILSDDPVIDHLENESDVNRYTFEVAQTGDALILVQSMQEIWSGYTYYWKASVYRLDGALIAESNLKGANELNVISLARIDAGVYYVEIAPVNTANPLMGGFTADPYELTLLRLYESSEVNFDDELQTFDKKYQIIGKIDDTYFIKAGEGTAWGAFYRNDEGAIVPMLVSESADAVNYIVSSTGQYTKAANTSSLEKDDVKYYYTSAHWIDRYTENKQKWQSKSDASYLFIDERGDATVAEEILIEVEKAEKGIFMYYVSNYWYWPLLVIVFIGFLAVSSFCQVDGPV